jgi:hypothetical protein
LGSELLFPTQNTLRLIRIQNQILGLVRLVALFNNPASIFAPNCCGDFHHVLDSKWRLGFWAKIVRTGLSRAREQSLGKTQIAGEAIQDVLPWSY